MAEIIDAHVHIGRHHLPIEHIDSLLKAAGISRAVVFADPESDDSKHLTSSSTCGMLHILSDAV